MTNQYDQLNSFIDVCELYGTLIKSLYGHHNGFDLLWPKQDQSAFQQI